MLILEELVLKGIGRFVEEQIIKFDSLGKFVQLEGQNNNTKGSSGAGKSTVFMALDYLFGINHRPSTVLKSRYSDEGIYVRGTFKFDGKSLIITRSKKLAIDLDGEITSGNSAKTEELLDQIIGIPRDIFRKMYHKKQKEGGFFLSMGPSDLNDFLTSALKLDEYKAKILIAENKVEELKEKKKTTDNDLIAANSGKLAISNSLASLGSPPRKEMDQATVLVLKTKSDKSNENLQNLLTQHKTEKQQLELFKPYVKTEKFDRDKLTALENRMREIENQRESVVNTEKQRQYKAKTDKTNLESEIKRLHWLVSNGMAADIKISESIQQLKLIKEGKCFNCGSDWVDANKEEKIKKELLQYKEATLAGEKALETIPQLEAQIKEYEGLIVEKELLELITLTTELKSVTDRVLVLREEERKFYETNAAESNLARVVFEEKQSSLYKMHAQQLENVKGQADIDRRALEMAVNLFKTYQVARTGYDHHLASLKTQEVTYDQKIEYLTETSKTIEEELLKAEELKRALKSYLSCSFDDALETISENATTLIRNIPNMASSRIELKGIKEMQDGKVKEEVTAILSMDGEENIPIKSLSGGERTSLDLSIDLAVIDLLESNRNMGINLFIMDEPFEGQDFENIEMALEMLKNSNTNKRLIIVDHNDMVKEFCNNKIIVIRDGLTSKIVQ